MTRYTTASGPEGEYEPGSRGRVLRNLLGIKSRTEMNELETAALGRVEQAYLLEGPVSRETCFTAALIRQMHGDWLGGIYEWAGKYRTVDMSKGGFVFPPAYLIERNMATLEREMLTRLTPCRPGSISEICMAVSQVHADLLLIHPFRDGNGRIARVLANLMIAQAGLPLPNYAFVGRRSRTQREDYFSAVVKGYRRDYRDLAAFFLRAVDRKLAAERNLESERGDAPSSTDDS
jgi:cell filamentation protein